ncbi:MAG: MBL fold metallo-hydrolase [Candidatus Micrarchaeia archaeon]
MANSFEYQGVRITWFGHSSFLIEYGPESVYVDNYVLPSIIEKKATIVIHTHGHYDHCADCAKIADAKTVYAGMCRHARDLIGNTLKIRDVKIEFVDAYNNGKPFHHKNSGCGVVLDLGGTRIYHAGDTDFIAEMRRYRCDVALLPIGGTATMDEKEAVEAVKVLGPKIAIPMHYNYVPMTKADPTFFRKLVEQNAPRTRVVVLDAVS